MRSMQQVVFGTVNMKRLTAFFRMLAFHSPFRAFAFQPTLQQPLPNDISYPFPQSMPYLVFVLPCLSCNLDLQRPVGLRWVAGRF